MRLEHDQAILSSFRSAGTSRAVNPTTAAFAGTLSNSWGRHVALEGAKLVPDHFLVAMRRLLRR